MSRILLFLFLAFVTLSIYAVTADELREKADQAVEQDEYDMAIEYHNQAIELEPDNAEAYYLRGIFNLENIDDDLAVNDFNKAIDLGFSKIDIYYYRGLANEGFVEYEDAIDDLTIFLNSNSEKSELMLVNAYESRGWCNYDLGNLAVALEDYLQVIDIDPLKYGSHNIIASIYLKNEQFEKSIEEYNNMLKLFPDKNNIIRALIVVVKVNAGDFEGAINDCTQLIQEEYTTSAIFCLRGVAYLGINEYQLAIDDANTAIEKYVRADEAYYVKAKANLGLGNLYVARNEINEALRLCSQNDIYIKNKDIIEKAIMDLDK